MKLMEGLTVRKGRRYYLIFEKSVLDQDKVKKFASSLCGDGQGVHPLDAFIHYCNITEKHFVTRKPVPHNSLHVNEYSVFVKIITQEMTTGFSFTQSFSTFVL